MKGFIILGIAEFEIAFIGLKMKIKIKSKKSYS